MWPCAIDWQELRFGVEIEFVGGDPTKVELLPGWSMALDELQTDSTGVDSGAELKPSPMLWQEREQIREMLARLRAQGAEATWSCGLHVHVGLEPWGQAMVLPLLDAALACQEALQALVQTSDHRRVYCPPVIPQMRDRFLADPVRDSLVHRGRPQAHRCGVNVGAWFDFSTVEFRFANGSLDYEAVLNTVELYLRFVAAVGRGDTLPGEAAALAAALGAPRDGYPEPAPAPLWHHERVWLDEALFPVLAPLVEQEIPGGEIYYTRPVPEGLRVVVEHPEDHFVNLLFRPTPGGWELVGSK